MLKRNNKLTGTRPGYPPNSLMLDGYIQPPGKRERHLVQVSAGNAPESICCPLRPTGTMPRLFMAVAQAPWSPTGTLRWFCSAPRPSAAAPQTHTDTHQPPGGATQGEEAQDSSSVPLAIAGRHVCPLIRSFLRLTDRWGMG